MSENAASPLESEHAMLGPRVWTRTHSLRSLRRPSGRLRRPDMPLATVYSVEVISRTL